MEEYQKIPGPYRREVDGPRRNQIIEGAWTSPELEYTANLNWHWTEKVDGTNIRIHWNGYKVIYGGRTDNAQIPAKLISVLDGLVTEEAFEQQFQDQPVTLYGEGYGAGIQSGGIYRPDMSFVLFDVRIAGFWLQRDNLLDIAKAMGLDVVPLAAICSIPDAIEMVRLGRPSAWNHDRLAEGLVGVTTAGLLDRAGRRLIVKVKTKDFRSKA